MSKDLEVERSRWGDDGVGMEMGRGVDGRVV